MRKIIFFMFACLFATSVTAENEATYNPETGSVEIPEVVILGQEGEYSVKMQQQEGLKFEVIEVVADGDGVEDSDELRSTYDPETGVVEIPLVIVLSMVEGARLETFSVKMQQKEGLNFDVIEVTQAEVKYK